MTTITAQPNTILNKEERIRLASAWSLYFNSKQASASDMLLYALLRGKPILNGFTAITSPAKLANGHAPWGGYRSAINTLYWAQKRPEFDRKLIRLLPNLESARLAEIKNELSARIERARKDA